MSNIARLAGVASIVALAPLATADVIVINPSKDNTLYAENGNESNGAGQHFFCGRNGDAQTRRAVVAGWPWNNSGAM